MNVDLDKIDSEFDNASSALKECDFAQEKANQAQFEADKAYSYFVAVRLEKMNGISWGNFILLDASDKREKVAAVRVAQEKAHQAQFEADCAYSEFNDQKKKADAAKLKAKKALLFLD